MQSVAASSNRSVSHLAVTWVLLIPLFYFASQGQLWFQSATMNNSLSFEYGPLVNAPGNHENTLIAMVVFSVVFLAVFSRVRMVIGLCLKDRVFAPLAMLAVVSCLWSHFPLMTLMYALYIAGNTFFSFYLHRRFSLERLLQMLLILGWICVLFSIGLCLFFPLYGVDQIAGLHGAWRGMYSQKNDCSMMTVVLLSPAFYVPAKTALARFSRVAYIALSVFVVIMTQSTGGLVLLGCLLVCVVGMRIIQRFRSKDRTVVVIVGAAIALLLILAVISHFNEISYLIGKDPGLTGRTGIWKVVMVSVMKKPILGYGYKGFWGGLQGESANATLAIGWVAASTHNGFLDVWLTLGAVGLGLVVYSFARAFQNAVLCFRIEGTPYLQWCICVVVLILVLSSDETQLMQPNHLIWILYILACLGLAEGAKRIRLGLSHE